MGYVMYCFAGYAVDEVVDYVVNYVIGDYHA